MAQITDFILHKDSFEKATGYKLVDVKKQGDRYYFESYSFSENILNKEIEKNQNQKQRLEDKKTATYVLNTVKKLFIEDNLMAFPIFLNDDLFVLTIILPIPTDTETPTTPTEPTDIEPIDTETPTTPTEPTDIEPIDTETPTTTTTTTPAKKDDFWWIIILVVVGIVIFMMFKKKKKKRIKEADKITEVRYAKSLPSEQEADRVTEVRYAKKRRKKK